jgi:hypothetical protein
VGCHLVTKTNSIGIASRKTVLLHHQRISSSVEDMKNIKKLERRAQRLAQETVKESEHQAKRLRKGAMKKMKKVSKKVSNIII